MKSRLPEYKTPSLMGPTGVAKKTMPTCHVYNRENPFKYTPWEKTNIRECFKKHGAIVKTPKTTREPRATLRTKE